MKLILLVVVVLDYYKILSLLNKPKVEKKQTNLEDDEYDIPIDYELVEVIPIIESNKVEYLRKLTLMNDLVKSTDWFTLENTLLDKYYDTGELIKPTDMGRILNIDLKPVSKYLINESVEEVIIKSEEPLFRERFIKNLEELERRVDLNRQEYLQMVKENPRLSRYDLLKRYYERGSNSWGQKYSIKRLESLSRSLNGYKMNINKYYDVLDNLPKDIDVDNDVYKTWHVTPNERTRHSGMDGVTVKGLNTPFKVVHDITGVFDYLQYPHDIDNEHNNCANTCNCLCYYDVDIIKDGQMRF